jgi:hypothetical protein
LINCVRTLAVQAVLGVRGFVVLVDVTVYVTVYVPVIVLAPPS